MKINVAYALPDRQISIAITLQPGATVIDAIEQSGLPDLFPNIDFSQQKVGVFGKLTRLDALLEEGDRVEIYRPLTRDPKTVRKRAKLNESSPTTAESES